MSLGQIIRCHLIGGGKEKDDQSEVGLHKAAACGSELHKADSGDAVEEEHQ